MGTVINNTISAADMKQVIENLPAACYPEVLGYLQGIIAMAARCKETEPKPPVS